MSRRQDLIVQDPPIQATIQMSLLHLLIPEVSSLGLILPEAPGAGTHLPSSKS